MNFERHKDPIKAINIGQAYLRSILEKLNGIIFNEDQTQQMINFQNEYFWKGYPPPATAADFMEPFLLNKHASHSIVIGIKGDRFIVFKNLHKKYGFSKYLERNQEGDLKDLYTILLKI